METQDSVADRQGLGSAAQPARAAADFAYDGVAGRTRRETFHVTMADGALKSIPAHRVVNVGTDPDLRDPALAGVLHRFESGEELAIPFVFHDPAARKLALVIPPSLRHRELAERARLLEELAADPDHPIPPYVRTFAVVIGLEQLAEYLALPAPAGSALDAARREATLQEREAELSGAQADLQERARELDRRSRALDEREAELSGQADRLAALERELAQRGEKLDAGEHELQQRIRALEVGDAADAAEIVGDEEVEEVTGADDDDAPEVMAEPGEVALVDEGEVEPVTAEVDVQALTPEAFEPGDEVAAEPDADDAAELVSDADVEEVADDETAPSAGDGQDAGDADADAEPVDAAELLEVDAAADGPSMEERRAALDDPDARAEAAVALCADGGPDELDAVRRALPRMTPGEMARVFAALARRGEPSGDVLVRCLQAPEPYVRHGAVLAAGELGERRAMRPLFQLLRGEPEDLWQEAGRVLGGFGDAAFREARAALEAGADGSQRERLAYALAALAEGGMDERVRWLREKGDEGTARVAREAMTLREVVRAHDEAARGGAPLDPSDPVRAFSRRFYEALGEPEA